MEYILTQTLPGMDPSLLRGWLGERWMLVHRAHYARAHQWSSIISSRINQSQPEYRDWPSAMSRALQLLQRQRRTCLIAPSTTTATWLQAGTQLGNLSTLSIQLDRSQSVYQWWGNIERQLHACSDQFQNLLCISPAMAPADPELEELPIQDRLAVVLGHSVIALGVRQCGTLERLLKLRLQDQRFPAGTVSVRVHPAQGNLAQRWLDPSAVGWYVPTPSQIDLTGREHPLHCRRLRTTGSARPMTQVAVPIELMADWSEYLVHCVRGDQVRAEQYIDQRRLLDTLLRGRFHQPSAFQTLLKILDVGRLRASHKLLRGAAPLVSFSAVALPELLARRSYQSHLGRWDWEPYGLLVRRDWLQSAGARPVIYGDDQLYQQLSPEDRPFYQPAHRRTAKSHHADWQHECEWRLPGDLQLEDVPRHCLMLFVEYEHQAQVLAQESRWPVICLRRGQIPPRPVASTHRRRSSTQTGRN